jgi:hypothetical protein
MVNTRNR